MDANFGAESNVGPVKPRHFPGTQTVPAACLREDSRPFADN